MDTTEYEQTITSARQALAQAHEATVAATAAHEQAIEAVTTAETAFNENESDKAWSAVEKARAQRERAAILLKKRDRLEAEANEKLEASKRSLLAAQFAEVKEQADPTRWREQSASDFVELAQLDARMLAVAERLFERARAQVVAGYEAARLAEQLGDGYHQVPIGPVDVERYIKRSIGQARPYNALREHIHDPDTVFTPLRMLPSAEAPSYAEYFRGIAERSEQQEVAS